MMTGEYTASYTEGHTLHVLRNHIWHQITKRPSRFQILLVHLVDFGFFFA